jgi:hypothetical protein
VQEAGWDQGVDVGTTTIRRTVGFLVDPKDDLNILVSVVVLLTILVLGWVLVRGRPPGVRVVYTVAVLAPVVLSTTNTLTARSALSAFPLFIGLAGRVRAEVAALLMGVFAGVLAVFVLLIGPTLVLTP